MNTVDQIKEWAYAGWNQEDVAQALGLSKEKLRDFLRLHPEFTWPKGRTIAQMRYHAEKHPKGSFEQGRRLNAARLAKMPKYTVNGVTGTLRALALHFGVVSYDTVLKRRHKGHSVEDALLKPAHKGRCDQLMRNYG